MRNQRNTVIYGLSMLSLFALVAGCKSKNGSESSGIAKNIHLAAMNDDRESIQKFLDQGISIETADKDGGTPLLVASEYGSVQTLEFLLGKRSDIKARNHTGLTAIHCAANGGKVENLDFLLKQGADLSARTDGGWTALFNAAMVNKETAEYFINQGVDINAVDQEGDTALHYAAGNAEVEIVELLLVRGANPSPKNRKGETPLNWVRQRLDPRKVHPSLQKYASKYKACAELLEKYQKGSP